MRRFWTDAERDEVRRQYGAVPTRDLAATLGRTEGAVYQEARILGLCDDTRIDADEAFLSALRERHAAGDSDPMIAVRLGCGRRTVERHRRRLGLPSCRASRAYRDRVGARTREQVREAGCRNLAEVRVLAWAARAAGRGWPADLRGRHCDILEALESRGPMTRPEIAEAVGMPWKGTRRSLKSNDPEGSYLAHLAKRGLVVSLGRVARVTGKGSGRSMQVYTLAMTTQREEVR